MNVSGHAAIVTGGASGMGAETARALVVAGAKVTIMDVQQERLQDFANQNSCLAVTCDVTSSESAESAVAEAKEAHGAARPVADAEKRLFAAQEHLHR